MIKLKKQIQNNIYIYIYIYILKTKFDIINKYIYNPI